MSADAAKPATTSDLLLRLIDEMVGLRDDMRRRSGLPDVKIGKSKKFQEYEGKTASECPADVLLDIAGFLEWKAAKDREEGKEAFAAKGEREALMLRRWATVNRDVKAPEKKTGWTRPEPKSDAPPDTQNSRRDPAQPATETRPKWGGGGGWKKAGGT
jgi:hypothetical protein